MPGVDVMRADRPLTLAELHRERYASMVRLATLLTGSQPVAEDVVQDCFVRLHGRIERIDDPVAYLRRAVVNGCHSVGRRRRRELERRWDFVVPAAEPHADELSDALGSLPYRQRAALVLQFYGDLPGAEIADILGCRPGTVKALVHRGLARLREVLAE